MSLLDTKLEARIPHCNKQEMNILKRKKIFVNNNCRCREIKCVNASIASCKLQECSSWERRKY